MLTNGAAGDVVPCVVQIAKSFGAEVTGVDSAMKLVMLRSIGADHVIDYTEADYTKTGERYDRILDVAAYRSIFDSRRAMNPGGVYVMVPASIAGMLQTMFVGPLISMAGSQKMGMMVWKPSKCEDVVILKDLIETGKITPVIDRTYSLDEVSEALRYQEKGSARGKIVITV